VARHGPLAGPIRILPAGNVCQNRIRKRAGLSFSLLQFCDDSSNGLVHLINLIPVLAVVFHDEGHADTANTTMSSPANQPIRWRQLCF
jgi:hypothetical protein